MKDFEKILESESSNDLCHKSLELPNEFKEDKEDKEVTKDNVTENSDLKDLMNSNDIQMSWTKVNTSRWCGCNNACFNSCFNVG